MIFLLIIVGTALLINFGADYAKAHPEEAKKHANTIEQTIMDMGMSYFDSYEITKDENRFYVLKDDWRFYDFNDKKQMLDFAASISAEKRRSAYNKTVDKSKPSYEREYFSKTSELPRTKIYCKESGKLLGEFVMDEKVMDNASAMDIIKAAIV